MARLILLLAVFSQVADIAWLCLRGQHPGSSTREAVYFLSWLLTLAYPLLSRKHPAPLIGALFYPMAMTMEIVVRLVPGVTDPGPAAQGSFLPVCTSFVQRSEPLCLVSRQQGVVYLLSERHLKRHMLDAATPRLPLQTLDGWNHQSIAFGLLAFTATMVSGTYWLSTAGPQPGSTAMGAQL